MQTRAFLLVVVALAATAACRLTSAGEKSPDGAIHVDAAGAEPLAQAGKVMVVDVRTPEEYAEGHIAGAKNVDFLESDFEKQVAALERDKTYLIHCASGSRSMGALPLFQKLGFTSLYHLDGGFSAWKRAGKPVTK